MPAKHAPKPGPAPSKGALTYASSGVDIDAGDRFAASLGALMRRTHGQRVIPNPGGFAGLLRLDYNEQLFRHNYKDPVLVACCDGVGTKIKLAMDLAKFDTIGVDLVAMSVNDLIVQGAEPLMFLDYVAVHSVDKVVLGPILAGVAKGCEIAKCALIGGETAEMNDLYRAGEFDLAGFAVGVVELSRATDSARVEPGDVVLGLASSGVHSNGYSLVRKIVDHAGLDLGAVDPALDAERTVGEVLLEPTRIYVQPIVRTLRAYKVKKVVSGMAHITGGGLAGNLERALHPKVDAVLDRDAWEVPAVFSYLQKHGGVEPDEMDKVFNMGIGYCLIVRPTFAAAVARRLARFGETVHTIGTITRGTGAVRFA
ncbi:MAG: phosphoribosylformylglycinamidine cyclo-ligase [Phycisphaeraceae bacterium]|nr:MAG: phosphoribosylformylglycinamidine cyclo-ligase [Phycisphaeraceae bacterium]